MNRLPEDQKNGGTKTSRVARDGGREREALEQGFRTARSGIEAARTPTASRENESGRALRRLLETSPQHDLNVGRLQVAMCNSLLVCVRHGFRDLPGNL
jgi:hypothetical protein